MKKITILLSSILAALLLVSCVPLKPDGSFGSEEFLGKFHGSSIYIVRTPRGNDIYLAVNKDSQVESVQTTGKGATAVLTLESPVVGETLLQKLARLRKVYKEAYNNYSKALEEMSAQEEIVFGEK